MAPASVARLIAWMEDAPPGRFAAGLPEGVRVARAMGETPIYLGYVAATTELAILTFPGDRRFALAGFLVGSTATEAGRSALFADAVHMSPQGWRRLTIRYGIFFLVMAAANEAVWRTQPDSVWILFRFPGLQVLSLLFALTQVPMMMKDMKALEAAAELEP